MTERTPIVSFLAWLVVLESCIAPNANCEALAPKQAEKSTEVDEFAGRNRKELRVKLEKDRLIGFLDLISTIEKQDVPLKLVELAWSDGLEEANKAMGIKSPEYRNVLAKFSAFYQQHGHYEAAENLYVRDMQDQVGFKTNRFDNLKLTKQQTVLISDDMLCRAAIIEASGKRAREALEQRKQAVMLLDKAAIPVNLDKRAILAQGFVITGDDKSARREYKRYSEEAKNADQKFAGLISLARLENRQKNYALSLHYYDEVQKILNGPPMTNPFYPTLHLEMGRVNSNYKRFNEALAHYKQTLFYMEVKKPRPIDIYAAAMNEMAGIYRAQGDTKNYLKMVDMCVDYVTSSPTTIDLWYAINPLLLAARSPNLDGRPYYKRAIAVAENRKTKEGLLRCLLELASYEQRENWPAARSRYYEALSLARQEKLPMLAPLRQVGGSEYAHGNYKGALALFREAAVWIKGTEFESLHPDAYADLLLRMANCYACECNFSESQKMLDEFDKYIQATPTFNRESLANAMFMESRSQMTWLRGDHETMRTIFEKSRNVRRLNGVSDLDRARNIVQHIRIMHVKNCNQPMEATLANALIGLDAMKRELGPYSAYRAMISKALAQCLAGAGMQKEAEVISHRAEEDKKALLEHFNAH